MKYLVGITAALALTGAVFQANAQQYPSKPVRIIVPFSPGGGTDFIARLVAAKLSSNLGTQFIVENRAGAGSTIGTEFALKSPPDGYTLLLTSGSYTVASSLYKLRYDPIKDMAPIIQPDDGPFVMATHPSLPAKTVKQFVALAKSNPGAINFASSGQGSISHLSTELFSMISGIRLTHIPYKGTGLSVADTIAGHNQFLLAAIASAVPHVKSGRLRAISVTSAQRNSALSDVPTVRESGYDYEVSNWHGLMGPSGLSTAVIERLNSEINKIVKDPEFAQRIATDGLVPVGGTPERFLKLLKEEMANWEKVVKKAGIKIQ
ncbi:MAG: tripartite tricarboxylate transporter substrate binding protein [Burkholderiales bacterium]|nr:tripartite tricarboxylate transporter substrate binding protein [Burkholderiales bacterium]